MNTESPHLSGSTAAKSLVRDPRQHRRYVQLRTMLDDNEWASAYEDRGGLRQALNDLIEAARNGEPELDEQTLQILALEAEDYEDFCAFRAQWIQSKDAAPGTAPRQWLRARLRAWEEAERENLSRAEQFEESFWSGNERFRIT